MSLSADSLKTRQFDNCHVLSESALSMTFMCYSCLAYNSY